MNIVLLGAPGSGKGSMSDFLVQKKRFYHLSTGDALRNMARQKTPLGLELAETLKQGKLVSDDLVNKIVQATIENIDTKKYPAGIIFDGYPRTKSQAEYLKSIVQIDKVVMIDIPDEIIERRIINRRVCPNCNKAYSLVFKDLKPKNDEECDECKVDLICRKDDKAEVIQKRLDVYHKEIADLVKYYQDEKLLQTLNGTLPLDEWKAAILALAD